MTSAPRRVAVVGLGVATSLGLEVDELWRDLLAGRSGIAPIRQFPSQEFPVRIGSEVDLDALRARLGSRADGLGGQRTLLFALWAAERAWASAGLAPGSFDPARAAVCLGAGLFPALEDRLDGLTPELFDDPAAHAWWLNATPGGDEDRRRRSESGAAEHNASLAAVSGLLSRRFGLRGPSLTAHSACASATQALGHAFELVRDGRADVALSGGADSMLSMFCVAGFTLLGALSRCPDPTRASRPFDRERDGFVLGEGAGVLVLEELEQARRRGATILAEVIGYGSSLDAWRFTDVHPTGRGAADCLRRALDSAGLAPHDVDYVNAHGTATWQNDRVETRALHEVFGPHARRLAVSSTKSQLGHLLCAAGGLEAVITVLALGEQVLPPTLNLEHPDPECDLDYVPGQPRPARAEVALSNSFGFGGQNATLVLRRAPFEKPDHGAPEARRHGGAPGSADATAEAGTHAPRPARSGGGMRPTARRVVVTGLGAVSCLGLTLSEHWRRLLAGASGVRRLADARLRGLPARAFGAVDAAPLEGRLHNRMLRKLLLPSGLFAVEAAGQALRDAGLSGHDALAGAGLYFGSVSYELPGRIYEPALRASFGPDRRFDVARFARVGLELVDPLLIVKGLPNAAPCGIAIEHGLRGPNLSLAHGPTCGLSAGIAAYHALRAGHIDVALAGGSDSLLLAEQAAAHHLAGRLRADDGAALGARPFDARGGGHALGEGAAAWVLESEGHARERGARIYAEVLGAAETTDAGDPERAWSDCAARACGSGARPGAVFGLGLGLLDEDHREARVALRTAGGDAWLTAATGALGQTGAASGVFAALHAVLALIDGCVPPTAGHEQPAPGLNLAVPTQAAAHDLSRALVWSADGARHVALLLGRAS